jgi:hypothetical protein
MQDEEIRRAFVDEFEVELKVVSVVCGECQEDSNMLLRRGLSQITMNKFGGKNWRE